MKNEIRTTGDLRTMLANCVKAVAQGSMDIERAQTVHKLAKNITESLYSETKIAMFRHEVAQPCERFGDLPIGAPSD